MSSCILCFLLVCQCRGSHRGLTQVVRACFPFSYGFTAKRMAQKSVRFAFLEISHQLGDLSGQKSYQVVFSIT